MTKPLRQHLKGEKGQALAIVLALLALAGLTVATTLNYATTSLKGASIAADQTRAVYAASSGIEHALWALNRGQPPATATPEDVNGMAVEIATVGGESLTLSLGELVTPGSHADWISVSTNITPVGANTNNVTITVATSANMTPNKKLGEFGIMLPAGYAYVADSAVTWHATNLSVDGNPSIDNPNSTGDALGTQQWLKWAWDSGKGPTVTTSQTYTQKFQVTGNATTFGAYSWIVGQSTDVGTVGQITGTLTTITATAKRPSDNRTMARITAESIVGSGGVFVFSWKITN